MSALYVQTHQSGLKKKKTLWSKVKFMIYFSKKQQYNFK